MLLLLAGCGSAPTVSPGDDPPAPAPVSVPATPEPSPPPPPCLNWEVEALQVPFMPPPLQHRIDGGVALPAHAGARVVSDGAVFAEYTFDNVHPGLAREIVFHGELSTPPHPRQVTLTVTEAGPIDLVLVSGTTIQVLLIEEVPGAVERIWANTEVDVHHRSESPLDVGDAGVRELRSWSQRLIEEQLAAHQVTIDTLHFVSGADITLTAGPPPPTLEAPECGTITPGVDQDIGDFEVLGGVCPELADAEHVCATQQVPEGELYFFDADGDGDCMLPASAGRSISGTFEWAGPYVYGCSHIEVDGPLFRTDLRTGVTELTYVPCRSVRVTPCGLLVEQYLHQRVDYRYPTPQSRMLLYRSFEAARCNRDPKWVVHGWVSPLHDHEHWAVNGGGQLLRPHPEFPHWGDFIESVSLHSGTVHWYQDYEPLRRLRGFDEEDETLYAIAECALDPRSSDDCLVTSELGELTFGRPLHDALGLDCDRRVRNGTLER